MTDTGTMTPQPPEPLDRRTFDAAELMAAHPPVWQHPNKQAVFEVACPPGSIHRGQLKFTRWAAKPLPERLDINRPGFSVDVREDYFDYGLVLDPAVGVEWHLNFADPDLFGFYGSRLFAQDEMQVTEHPALGALREALRSLGARARTSEDGHPSPVLVRGVERRCQVATDPDAAEGRPDGLYGNAFARATREAVARATTAFDPPSFSNVIAVTAPAYGRGRYRVDEIELVLSAAYTGFQAAVLESGPERRVAIHTGYWGCGAYGGNRTLMALLQVVAAEVAGIDRLVFHAGADGGGPIDDALQLVTEFRNSGNPPGVVARAELVDRIAGLGLRWGVGDGN